MSVERSMKKQQHLWQNHSPNFLAEKTFNSAVAELEPYCAVCSLFCSYEKVQTHSCSGACVIAVVVKVIWTLSFLLCKGSLVLLWPLKPQKDPFIASNPAHAFTTPRPGSFTRPLVPEICFSGAGNAEPPPTNGYIGEDGTSLLICCGVCGMQVHASKYSMQQRKC